MRLNKSNKIELVKSVVNAKLKSEHEALVKEAKALGMRCIDELFGDMERQLRSKLNAEEIAAVGGTGITVHVSGLYIPRVACELAGDNCEFFPGCTVYPLRLQADYITTVEARYISNFGIKIDAAKHPDLAEALSAYQKKGKAFVDKAKDMIDTLWNSVSNFTTRNKLLEAMPSLEPYLPAKPTPNKLMPLESINKVNAMLRGDK